MINPTRPHPGKVSTQANSISPTVDQLTEENRLAAPTPIIAVVLVWVVLTGSPKTDEIIKQTAAAKSALKP